MNKIIIAALLSFFIAAPALAATTPATPAGSIGLNYSVDSVLGIQGEFNISSMTNHAPVSVQVFWKNYTQNLAPYASWATTAIGVAGIYDFSALTKMDKKVHPYAGVGLMSVTYSWRGAGPSWQYNGVDGGLYVTAGVRYSLTPQMAADFNYNNFGDLTAGLNFSF